jgi:hypothetical protein
LALLDQLFDYARRFARALAPRNMLARPDNRGEIERSQFDFLRHRNSCSTIAQTAATPP